MSSKPLVVIVLADGAGILQADVAGGAVSDYLLPHLRLRDGAEFRVLLPAGAPLPAWCAEYSAVDAREVGQLGDPLLILDARAWLPQGLLQTLVERVRRDGEFVRLIARDADGRTTTLAAALPARLLTAPIAAALTDVERLLTWEWADRATPVEASSLVGARTSRLLESLIDVALIERDILRERSLEAMRAGVRLRDPETIRIRGELVYGNGVEIDLDVIIEGRVTLEDGVRVGAHSIIKSARIGRQTRIEPFSIVDGSSVGASSVIGPYGRIRPGSTLGDRVQIGNYVEVKSSRIGDGCRINHHSFIGDADLADGVTIGAGTITCNHDGVGNVQTVIERGAYIGSGCNLVAPVRIGEGATIGAGSTITRDVPAAMLTLARSQQVTIEKWQGPRRRREPRS